MRTLLAVVAALVALTGCRPRDTAKSSASSAVDVTNTSRDNATNSALHSSSQIAGAPATPAATEHASMPDSSRRINSSSDPTTAASENSSQPNARADTAADGGRQLATNETAAAEVEIDAASWTSQRIALLPDGGPRFVDLRVNVGNVELESGLIDAAAQLAEEIEVDFAKGQSWESLLEKPLVQSGWLGNLVPTPEQREQLFSLYDSSRDKQVDPEEFRAFLTRGLSRTPQLRVVQGKPAAPLLLSPSAWGPTDQNGDGELSSQELEQTPVTMLQYDFDGDRILTPTELRSINDTSMESMELARGTGMLDVAAVLPVDIAKPLPVLETLFKQYTFTESIPRDSFFDWPDRRVQLVDTDSDSQLTSREMRAALELQADCTLNASFPNSLPHLLPIDALRSVSTSISCLDDSIGSSSSAMGSRIDFPGCVLTVLQRDAHAPATREYIERQLASSLDNPQLSAALVGPLGLQESAAEVLRKHGKNAGPTAWKWLAAPRHWHITLSWSVPEQPWFELMDANADQKLVTTELDRFVGAAASWDRNRDGSLQIAEMPLAVVLTVSRDDTRLNFSSLGGNEMEKRGANALPTPAWFKAMDYNSDSELTKSEFLGEASDFNNLDQNQDGTIEAREVYVPH